MASTIVHYEKPRTTRFFANFAISSIDPITKAFGIHPSILLRSKSRFQPIISTRSETSRIRRRSSVWDWNYMLLTRVTYQHYCYSIFVLSKFSSTYFHSRFGSRQVGTVWSYSKNNPDSSLFQILHGSYWDAVERISTILEVWQGGSVVFTLPLSL